MVGFARVALRCIDDANDIVAIQTMDSRADFVTVTLGSMKNIENWGAAGVQKYTHIFHFKKTLGLRRIPLNWVKWLLFLSDDDDEV